MIVELQLIYALPYVSQTENLVEKKNEPGLTRDVGAYKILVCSF